MESKKEEKSFALSCIQQYVQLCCSISPGQAIQLTINLAKNRTFKRNITFSVCFSKSSMHMIRITPKTNVKAT